MFKILVSILCFTGIIDCLQFVSHQNINPNLVIPTTSGYVQGIEKQTYTGTKYWAYQGIPFAKPPIGNLRFRPPEQPLPWRGVLDGSKEGNGCVETIITLNNEIVSWGDEDCLFINVYTPRYPKNQGGQLPVLVWIYGGAFIFGNSSSTFYGPEKLLDQNVITVTFNYRVGPFGFLNTEDMESPGNYGLKDQNMALQWVQKNIEYFGGNKDRVTIYGESAGAASVMYHLVSPKSRGLFAGVISSSGSPLCSWAYTYDPAKTAFEYGLAAGIDTRSSKELVAKLREADIGMLKSAARALVTLVLPLTIRGGFPFSPSIEPYHEDAFLTKSVFASLDKGEFHKVPVMMGMNNLETVFFAGPLELLKPINFLYDISPSSLPSNSMNIRTQVEKRKAGLEILKEYFKDGSYLGATEYEYLQFTTDDRFTRPLLKTAQLISKHTPLYFYLFSYITDFGEQLLKGLATKKPIQGVGHSEEMFYIWKREGIPLPTGFDQIIASRLMKVWTNFIRTGNPTPAKENILENVLWPSFTSRKNFPYYEIGSNISVRYNYKKKQINFWSRLYQKYGHPPYITY